METVKTWKDVFVGKKILLWGFGREGLSSYNTIRKYSEDVIYITDGNKSEDNQKRIASLTVNTQFIQEETVDFESFDLVLKSPGIVVPKGLKIKNLSSQSELFLEMYRDNTIGITGTKGKSTTTSMLFDALSTEYNCHLVGNIGIPCFEAIDGMEQGDLACFEISCHQLEYANVSPHVAVYLNLFEEHLDHYESFEAYGNAKANIFRFQKEGDVCILSKDLPYVPDVNNGILIGKDITSSGNTLVIPGSTMDVTSKVVGQHNYTNMAVVYYICKLYGISDEHFKQAMEQFTPLNHRLMDLGVKDGVRYVDDSISTIGQSCISAMESLKDTQTVLIGGMDRGIDYSDLKDYISKRVDVHCIFMYATGKRIYQELETEQRLHTGMHVVSNLHEAVLLAKKITEKGKIVLLSPAASSYDSFKNFEERGDVFKSEVFEGE